MLAVLYVSHGTRVAEGVLKANQFLKRCMDQVNVPIQRICYLELVKPDILEGIGQCVAAGADRIIVQPILLLSARHDKRDIPGAIEKARAIYPHVRFTYGKPFGVADCIIDILLERLAEKGRTPDSEGRVLIVGRGSSDPETPKTFSRISAELTGKGISPVSVCYMAAAKPLIHEGLAQAGGQNTGTVYILPCLLFPGILMRTIRKEIAESAYRTSFTLCPPLGYHPALIGLLRQRIEASVHERLSAQY
ncbi:sirohydrochlorin chelatase [Sporolactobacillus vineae]|uniref:sirohydrochlorin chelatase n=1 Tax=Sporolactobacillus vineae TaxID=444463 RepID=UPI000289701D|nr:sirohydrochlorin chelatase [Sporolactobacillus vineae]